MKYINMILCFLFGHLDRERHLTEDELTIKTERCSRCKVPLGFGTYKIAHIPPPNSTHEQIKSWEEYCETKYQNIRDSFK